MPRTDLLLIVTLLNSRAIRRASYGLFLKEGETIGLQTSILIAINKSIGRRADNNGFTRRIYLYFGPKLSKYEYDLGPKRLFFGYYVNRLSSAYLLTLKLRLLPGYGSGFFPSVVV